MNTATQKVPWYEKVGYSLGDGAANLVFQMTMMFQLFFYTDVFGIKASTAGMILLIARVFDAFVDPVVGILSDRTNTRWGKYRPWILWTALPFAIFFVLAFTTPDFSERGKIMYAGITYVLLMTIYSFNNTPYSSLGGVMTGDIKERTSISTYRFVAATIATFVVQGLTLPLVSKFGQGDPRRGWLLTVSLFAVIVVVLFVITFFTTKERIEPPVNQKTSVKQDFKDIISNRPWKAMFVLTLFLFITLAMWGSSMSYYFNYVVDKDALFGFLSKFGLISEVGKTYGAGHRFLDAFGLIAYHTGDVFTVFFTEFVFGIHQNQSFFGSHFGSSLKQGIGVFFDLFIFILAYQSLCNDFFFGDIFVVTFGCFGCGSDNRGIEFLILFHSVG
jgi:GPH family glycoside/pentoside/hexuronide:cation symporter